jgi:transcriptional regulator with XRE-family HTH domain
MPLDRAAVNRAFGQVLKGAVTEQGKTQKGVGEVLGQATETINRIFNGKREMTVAQFFRTAEYIGIPADDLLGRVIRKLDGLPVSEPLPSLEDARQKKQREASQFTGEQFDELHGQHKALAEVDEERGQDEPDIP